MAMRRRYQGAELEMIGIRTMLKCLAVHQIAGRRRMLRYVESIFEELPLTDEGGKIVDLHPIDTEPPMVPFPQREREPVQ